MLTHVNRGLKLFKTIEVPVNWRTQPDFETHTQHVTWHCRATKWYHHEANPTSSISEARHSIFNLAALTVVLGMKITSIIPFLLQKAVYMILHVKMVRLNCCVDEFPYFYSFKKRIRERISQLAGTFTVCNILKARFTRVCISPFELFSCDTFFSHCERETA